jgi:negative regulator of flagellin synthesis FlgM
MTLEINGIPPSKAQGTTDDPQLKQAVEQPQAQQESGKSSTIDTVSLSDNAVQLGKLGESVAATPAVDAQRVEQVKQAIENGSYEVDPAKVAEKLMRFESMLKS